MSQTYAYLYKVIVSNRETKEDEIAFEIPVKAENKQQALEFVTSDSITALLKEVLKDYTKEKYKDEIKIEVFVVRGKEEAEKPTYEVFTSLKKIKQ